MTSANDTEIHPVWCEPNECDGFHESATQIVHGTVQIEPSDHECCNRIEVVLCQMDPVEDANSSLVPHVRMMSSAEPGSAGGMTRFAISRFTADETRRLAEVLVDAAEQLDSYIASVNPAVGR